jgi:hypothetical protein
MRQVYWWPPSLVRPLDTGIAIGTGIAARVAVLRLTGTLLLWTLFKIDHVEQVRCESANGRRTTSAPLCSAALDKS